MSPPQRRADSPAWAALGAALAALAAASLPAPWPLLRRVRATAEAAGLPWPVPDPAPVIARAFAAAGHPPAPEPAATLLRLALTDPLDAYLMRRVPPRSAPLPPPPAPAAAPPPPFRVAGQTACRQWGARLACAAAAGYPWPPAWTAGVLAALRAGYGDRAGRDGWHGFSRDLVAVALWGAPADALAPDARTALAHLWRPLTPSAEEEDA